MIKQYFDTNNICITPRRNSEIINKHPTLQYFKNILDNEKIFVDENFPPKISSLVNNIDKYILSDLWKNVHFTRILNNKIKEGNREKNMTLFRENLLPLEDIQLGFINNHGYFITALKILAQKPWLIKRLFITHEINQIGIYCIWICDNGQWHPIIIDDNLISLKGKLAGISGINDEFWSPLLEKAYSKINKCYENIICYGTTEDVLRDFTGAPIISIDHDNNNNDSAIEIIKWGIDNKFLTSGQYCHIIEEKNKRAKDYLTLAIMRYKEVIVNNEIITLLLVKILYGILENKEDFLLKNSKLSKEIKSQLICENIENTFWMSINQYMEICSKTIVLKYKDDFYYTSCEIDGENCQSILRFSILSSKECEVNICLNQADQRKYFTSVNDLNHQEYNYAFARILLAKIKDDGKLIFINGTAGSDRNIQLNSVFLEQGNYIIAIEIHNHQNSTKKESIVISAYSEEEIHFERFHKPNFGGILNSLVYDLIKKGNEYQQKGDYSSIGEPSISKCFGIGPGFIYLYYENQSRKYTLIEYINFKTKGLELLNNELIVGNDRLMVEVFPNSKSLIIFKILNATYSYEFNFENKLKSQSRITSNQRLKNTLTLDDNLYMGNITDRTFIQTNNNYNIYLKDYNYEHDLFHKPNIKQQLSSVFSKQSDILTGSKIIEKSLEYSVTNKASLNESEFSIESLLQSPLIGFEMQSYKKSIGSITKQLYSKLDKKRNINLNNLSSPSRSVEIDDSNQRKYHLDLFITKIKTILLKRAFDLLKLVLNMNFSCFKYRTRIAQAVKNIVKILIRKPFLIIKNVALNSQFICIESIDFSNLVSEAPTPKNLFPPKQLLLSRRNLDYNITFLTSFLHEKIKNTKKIVIELIKEAANSRERIYEYSINRSSSASRLKDKFGKLNTAKRNIFSFNSKNQMEKNFTSINPSSGSFEESKKHNASLFYDDDWNYHARNMSDIMQNEAKNKPTKSDIMMNKRKFPNEFKGNCFTKKEKYENNIPDNISHGLCQLISTYPKINKSCLKLAFIKIKDSCYCHDDRRCLNIYNNNRLNLAEKLVKMVEILNRLLMMKSYNQLKIWSRMIAKFNSLFIKINHIMKRRLHEYFRILNLESQLYGKSCKGVGNKSQVVMNNFKLADISNIQNMSVGNIIKRDNSTRIEKLMNCNILMNIVKYRLNEVKRLHLLKAFMKIQAYSNHISYTSKINAVNKLLKVYKNYGIKILNNVFQAMKNHSAQCDMNKTTKNYINNIKNNHFKDYNDYLELKVIFNKSKLIYLLHDHLYKKQKHAFEKLKYYHIIMVNACARKNQYLSKCISRIQNKILLECLKEIKRHSDIRYTIKLKLKHIINKYMIAYKARHIQQIIVVLKIINMKWDIINNHTNNNSYMYKSKFNNINGNIGYTDSKITNINNSNDIDNINHKNNNFLYDIKKNHIDKNPILRSKSDSRLFIMIISKIQHKFKLLNYNKSFKNIYSNWKISKKYTIAFNHLFTFLKHKLLYVKLNTLHILKHNQIIHHDNPNHNSRKMKTKSNISTSVMELIRCLEMLKRIYERNLVSLAWKRLMTNHQYIYFMSHYKLSNMINIFNKICYSELNKAFMNWRTRVYISKIEKFISMKHKNHQNTFVQDVFFPSKENMSQYDIIKHSSMTPDHHIGTMNQTPSQSLSSTTFKNHISNGITTFKPNLLIDLNSPTNESKLSPITIYSSVRDFRSLYGSPSEPDLTLKKNIYEIYQGNGQEDANNTLDHDINKKKNTPKVGFSKFILPLTNTSNSDFSYNLQNMNDDSTNKYKGMAYDMKNTENKINGSLTGITEDSKIFKSKFNSGHYSNRYADNIMNEKNTDSQTLRSNDIFNSGIINQNQEEMEVVNEEKDPNAIRNMLKNLNFGGLTKSISLSTKSLLLYKDTSPRTLEEDTKQWTISKNINTNSSKSVSILSTKRKKDDDKPCIEIEKAHSLMNNDRRRYKNTSLTLAIPTTSTSINGKNEIKEISKNLISKSQNLTNKYSHHSKSTSFNKKDLIQNVYFLCAQKDYNTKYQNSKNAQGAGSNEIFSENNATRKNQNHIKNKNSIVDKTQLAISQFEKYLKNNELDQTIVKDKNSVSTAMFIKNLKAKHDNISNSKNLQNKDFLNQQEDARSISNKYIQKNYGHQISHLKNESPTTTLKLYRDAHYKYFNDNTHSHEDNTKIKRHASPKHFTLCTE